MDKITVSDLSRGGVERPLEFPNSDEQLLTEEDDKERGFLGRG